MKNPFPWRMVLYASIIYLLIFGLALGYKTYVITPTQNLLKTTTLTIGQRTALNASIASVGTNQAKNAASNQYTIETLVVEIILISLFAFLEMKFHIISRLLKIWWVRWIFLILPVLILSALAVYALGWLVGIVFIVVATVAILGVYFVISKLAKKYLLGAIMILLTYAITYLLIASTAGLLSSNNGTILAIEAIYLVAMMAAALITIRQLGLGKNLKTLLNVTAALSCISFAIYFGTLINTIYLVILLVIFACYDYVAVFITKHMQFMASKLVSQMVPAMFLWGDKKELDAKLKQLGEGKPIKPPEPGEKKSTSTMLGTGDICLVAAAYCSAIFYAPKLAPFMLAGSIVGITICGYALHTGKFKQGIPALIFLVPCVLIFTAIGLFL